MVLRRGLIVRREEGIDGDSDENEAKLQAEKKPHDKIKEKTSHVSISFDFFPYNDE